MACPLIYTFTSFGCNEDCTRVYACPSFLCSNVCIFNVQFNYVAKHNEDDEGNDDDNSIGNGLITAYNLIVASSFSTIQKIYKHFSVDLNFKFSVFMNHLSNIYLNYDMLRVSNIPEPLEFSTQSYPNCTQYGRWYLSQYQIFQIFYNWFIDSNSKQMKEKKVRRLRSTYVRLYMWPEQKRQSTKMDYLKHVQLTEMNRIASHQSRVPSATNVLYLQLEWWMMTSSTCQKISCLSAYTHTQTKSTSQPVDYAYASIAHWVRFQVMATNLSLSLSPVISCVCLYGIRTLYPSFSFFLSISFTCVCVPTEY